MKRPGLLAEVSGLRVSDVDFMRGTVSPVQQYPADPLKTDMSRTPVPIPEDLALLLAAHVGQFSTKWVMCETTLDTYGHLWPDSDETTRAAIGNVIATRVNPADFLRTREEG